MSSPVQPSLPEHRLQVALDRSQSAGPYVAGVLSDGGTGSYLGAIGLGYPGLVLAVGTALA
jgi:hypothetical protein